MIPRYYAKELSYLYQAGKEFAEVHKQQAKYLHIDSESKEDRDPYVERLFEGFAFLAGRIHERLDDELPEYTEALFNLMWPHFLRPLPALAILEFKPRPGMVQQTTPIKVGTEVLSSAPAGEEKVLCQFRTTQEVRLQPLQLKTAAIQWFAGGKSQLNLAFGLEKGIEYQKLQLSPLRLYLHTNETVAPMMHLFFTREVEKVAFVAGDTKLVLSGQEWVQPAGLAENEGLVEYPPNSFSGYRLLQEYLSFRRKFWFVDVLGFEQFSPPPKTAEFQVQIFFKRKYPDEEQYRFGTENIRLFCTPIVNLFHKDAVPIRVDHLATEYRVNPDAQHPRSVEVYAVDSVKGTEEGTGERHDYDPFYSFNHSDGRAERYFTTRTRLGPAGRYENYIAPGGFQAEDGQLPIETLSVTATCTNGRWPSELGLKSITQPGPDFQNVATFENLTSPTLIWYPPHLEAMRADIQNKEKETFLWRLISHLAFNFRSVATIETLRGLLELYDWTTDQTNRRRLAGLRKVTSIPKELAYRGAIIRGVEVTIEIEDGHFAGEGDLCLFGLMMSEFLSMYATINSFVHLAIVTKPSERHYQWPWPEGVLKRGTLPVV
jgi:type VI secretion system protein ImpG